MKLSRAMWFLICGGTMITLWYCTSKREASDAILQVASPTSGLMVSVYLTEAGAPGYTVQYHGKTVIDSSRLGFILNQAPSLDKGFTILNTAITDTDETWEQPWGEQRLIRNHYNELRVALEEDGGSQRQMNVVFRVYDDGIGFRYEFPRQENLGDFEIMDELTEFAIAANPEAWWIPAYQGNRYEFIYQHDPVRAMTATAVHTPLTMQTQDSLYISIHEAALVDYASMTLTHEGNTLKCDLVPWKNGVRTYVTTTRVSPWRTLQIADKPGDLITSYLILNLNEPGKIEDTSWITTGKYVGVWWEMHINTGTWHQGPKHAANTQNTKRYIDFAAKHGFQGVLVEGWNEGWDGDWVAEGEKFNFTQAYPDYDVEYLTKYAKDKGVSIIGHHETGAAVENYENQLEDAFQFLEDHGMKAVKTGYVGDSIQNGEWHHGQYMVRHHQKVIETAARHHVMVVAHEPIKPTGLRRTWPNFISREGGRGQEYNAWADDGGNPPSHVAILPFTRLLAGPMDYTPGVFDITLPTQPNNQINGTLARELSLYVVLYAPWQMACDLPEHYEGHPAFAFIETVPTDWETTKVLEAKIGSYVTIARQARGNEDWYIGTLTNEHTRTAQIPLTFLTAGKTYTATIYQDADNADYRDHPTAYKINSEMVTADSTLTIELAAGGGAAISLQVK